MEKTLKQQRSVVLLGTMILLIGFLYYKMQILTRNNNGAPKDLPTNLTDCIPTFADGGGPYYKTNAPFRKDIAPKQNNGEKLIVAGKVLKNDCKTPVANAVLDIWQADELGYYQDEWYRGKIKTNQNGEYTFETVVPKGYGEGTGYRPPHIHFKIFKDSTEIITSQMFFPEVKDREGFDNAYIMKLETSKQNGSKLHKDNHDIILPI